VASLRFRVKVSSSQSILLLNTAILGLNCPQFTDHLVSLINTFSRSVRPLFHCFVACVCVYGMGGFRDEYYCTFRHLRDLFVCFVLGCCCIAVLAMTVLVLGRAWFLVLKLHFHCPLSAIAKIEGLRMLLLPMSRLMLSILLGHGNGICRFKVGFCGFVQGLSRLKAGLLDLVKI